MKLQWKQMVALLYHTYDSSTHLVYSFHWNVENISEFDCYLFSYFFNDIVEHNGAFTISPQPYSAPIMGYERFIYWFWSAQQKVDMHARSKNTFIVLKYAYFFVHNSQTINFSKPLLCSTLNCSDWSVVIDLLHAADVNNGTPITITEP